MNLSRIFWEDKQKDEESFRRLREQSLHELSTVNTTLDMFNVPLWGYIKDKLEGIEQSATDALVSGTTSAEGAAERIKLARHLANMEKTLLDERARLAQVLKEE